MSESPASAATCNDSWVGSAGGDWNTASNWSTNSVPTSSSDVCIGVAPSVGGTYTVTLNTSTQVAALTIGGAGGTQTLQIGTAGALLLSGGTVTNGANGAIANQGTFTVEAGGLGAQGTFNQDAGTTSGNPITINNANLNFTNTGASSFSFTSAGGHLSGNMAAGQSVAINSATVTVAGPLINAGVIQASGTGSTLNVSGGTLTNTGTIEADAGSTGAFTLDGTYDNQGAAPGGIVDDASMTLNGATLTNEGAITVASGATLTQVAGTVTNGANGAIANQGTFTVEAGGLGAQGTFNQDAGTTSGNPITINNANLNFTNTGASSFSFTSAGGHLSGNMAAGQSVAINSATVTVAGPLINAGVIQASGTGSTLNVSGGTLTNTGTIEADAGSTGAFTLDGTYDNQGAAPGGIVDDASMTLNGATLTNEGAITVASGATLTQVAGTVTNGANGAIANQGTFTVEAGGLGAQGTFNQDAGTTSGNPITINNANLNFTNTGASSFSFTSAGGHLSGNMAAGQSVAINSATVTVAGPLINAGVIQASGTGSTLNVSGGTLTNTGTIEADAGSTGAFTLDGTYDNQGAAPGGIVDDASMTLNGATLTNEGAITVASGATLTQVAGTVTNGANGAIANQGTFTVEAGGLGAQGTFNQDAGTTSGNPITINNANLNFTNTGASSFSFTSAGGHLSGNMAAGQSVVLQAGASVSITGGTLINNGSIISQATTAGTTISGSLINNGTFEVESGQATTIQGAYSQGSGGSLTVDVTGPSTFGHLSVTGTATLSGQLAVNTSGFTPTVGQSFAIITNSGARSGQFSSYSFGTQPYTTVYKANAVDLVVVAGLAITTTSLPNGVVGTAYPTAALAASGGTTPYSWQVTVGSLPAGLTLNPSTGAITGTPTGPGGSSSFTVTVTDSGVPDQTQSANLSITVDAAPSFTADSPPLTATVGTAYAYTFQATGTPDTITYSLAEGAPTFLSIDPESGAVTGTPPTGTTSFTYSVTASNGVSPDATAGPFTVTVSAPPTFTADSPPLTATVGTAYAYTFAATGTPDTITYSLAEGAPAFLSIDPTTGAVTGTPPIGTTSFTYSVTASNGVSPDATAGPFTVTVSARPTFTADSPPLTATVGSPYAYTFAATGTPDTITYSLAEGAPTFLSIDPVTGAVTGTPPTGTTSFTYSVTASNGVSPDATAGPFDVVVSPANAAPTFTADSPPLTATVGTPYAYTFQATGTPDTITYSLAEGAPDLPVDRPDHRGRHRHPSTGTTSFTYSVTASNGVSPDATAGPFDVVVSPANAAPTFTADSPPLTATANSPYAYTFAATGTPDTITYSLAEGAPDLLVHRPVTGAVTGTPPTGTTSFTYSVIASNGVSPDATAGPFTVTVSPANAAPTFTADSPPLTATVGTPYAYTFAATGTPDTITYSLAEGAPAFLSIDPITGAVTGTPPTGTTSFTYSVIASNGVSPDATAGPFTVTVSPANAAPTFTADSPPLTATVGTRYAYTFQRRALRTPSPTHWPRVRRPSCPSTRPPGP